MKSPLKRPRHPVTAAVALLATAALAAGCSSGSAGSSGSTDAGGTPVPGGTLTVGIVGGSAKDSLDAQNPVTHPDEARVINLYDTLTTYDTKHQVQMDLADKITQSDGARTWTVQLRPGIKFSNGKPITAADVVYSYQRITNPKAPMAGAAGLSTLQPDKLEAPNPRTVVFHFSSPFAMFTDAVAQYSNGIVPRGYDPKKPVSSGPFQMESFAPGQQSVMTANPYYWRKGEPYVKKLVIIDFPDDTARVNALLGGQVDAIDQLPLGQYNVVKANANLRVLESKTGSWIPFTMRVDQAPFNNPKVRQAFRLIVDRKQMIEQVLGGHGELGNDMYAPLDRCYPKDLPQRTQNIPEAKKLLAEAGYPNLTVTLVTSPVAAGLVEAAQVFAQQAKAAGVTVKIDKVDPGTFYGPNYLKWAFAQDFWFTRDYLPQAAAGTMPKAPYNETHWNDAQWLKLINEANATVDEQKRCGLVQQAQKIEYDNGGYIVWGFPNNLDAYNTKVHGFEPDLSGIPLTSYNFRSVWLGK